MAVFGGARCAEIATCSDFVHECRHSFPANPGAPRRRPGRKAFFSEEKTQKTFPLINQATRKERLGGEPPPDPGANLYLPKVTLVYGDGNRVPKKVLTRCCRGGFFSRAAAGQPGAQGRRHKHLKNPKSFASFLQKRRPCFLSPRHTVLGMLVPPDPPVPLG